MLMYDMQEQQGSYHNLHFQAPKDSRQPDRRSQAMTTAAVVLSIVAISTVCCIYVSFVCGMLGITFALLSKGGELTMSQNAKTALWVSVFAVVLTVTLLAVSFAMVIAQYGSIDAFWEAYLKLMEKYSAEMSL